MFNAKVEVVICRAPPSLQLRINLFMGGGGGFVLRIVYIVCEDG